jgi:hypothetical protein
MPSMCGGDSSHPAYDPRYELSNNQVLSGDTLYTLLDSGVIEGWELDGSYTHYVPSEVKKEFINRGFSVK